MEFLVRYLNLFCLFSVIAGFQEALNGHSKKHPVNAGVAQGSIVGLKPFLI